MLHPKDFLRFLPVVLLAGACVPAKRPLYDVKADAHQQIAAAIAETSKAHKNVVLVFGANW